MVQEHNQALEDAQLPDFKVNATTVSRDISRIIKDSVQHAAADTIER